MKLIDDQDQQYEATTNVTVENELIDVTIRPGDSRVGVIPFHIKKGVRLVRLQYALDSGFAPDVGEWEIS